VRRSKFPIYRRSAALSEKNIQLAFIFAGREVVVSASARRSTQNVDPRGSNFLDGVPVQIDGL
jgi:hypothetical protein